MPLKGERSGLPYPWPLAKSTSWKVMAERPSTNTGVPSTSASSNWNWSAALSGSCTNGKQFAEAEVVIRRLPDQSQLGGDMQRLVAEVLF